MNNALDAIPKFKTSKRSSKKSLRYQPKLSGSPKRKSAKLNLLKNKFAHPAFKIGGKTSLKVESLNHIQKNRKKFTNQQLKARKTRSKRKGSAQKQVKQKIEVDLARKIQSVKKKMLKRKMKAKSIQSKKIYVKQELQQENSTSILSKNQRAVSGKRLRELLKNFKMKEKKQWGSNGLNELEKKLKRIKSNRKKKSKTVRKKKNVFSLIECEETAAQAGPAKVTKSSKTIAQAALLRKSPKKCGFNTQRTGKLAKAQANDQKTIFESFDRKSVFEADLFESFSHTKTVKTNEQISHLELPNISELRNKSILQSNVKTVEGGLKVYGKLRYLAQLKRDRSRKKHPANEGLVNYLDLEVEKIQKSIDLQNRILKLINKHKSNFLSTIKQIESKLTKIKKQFSSWADFNEDKIERLRNKSSLNRNIAMLTAEVFSVTPNRVEQSQTDNIGKMLRSEPDELMKYNQMLYNWQKQVKKFKRHTHKIADWFVETFSILSGIPSEKSNTYNPFNIIFSANSQLSMFKNKSRKNSVAQVASHVQTENTYWPGNSRKKNVTNCTYRNLRVGTSASYNGKDFSKILPNLKNNSLFKNPRKMKGLKKEFKFPNIANLVDSRFSTYLNEKDKTMHYIRGRSQRLNKEHMQESQIFLHVKFPSARIFSTTTKNNMFLNQSSNTDAGPNTKKKVLNFYPCQSPRAVKSFVANNLLYKEKKI